MPLAARPAKQAAEPFNSGNLAGSAVICSERRSDKVGSGAKAFGLVISPVGGINGPQPANAKTQASIEKARADLPRPITSPAGEADYMPELLALIHSCV